MKCLSSAEADADTLTIEIVVHEREVAFDELADQSHDRDPLEALDHAHDFWSCPPDPHGSSEEEVSGSPPIEVGVLRCQEERRVW